MNAGLEEDGKYNAPYEIQLINLGRILENPRAITDFKAEDFIDPSIRRLIRLLKDKDEPKESKNFELKTFLKERGVQNWGAEISDSKRALFDTQRYQAATSIVATTALIAIDHLQTQGSIGDEKCIRNAIAVMESLIGPSRSSSESTSQTSSQKKKSTSDSIQK